MSPNTPPCAKCGNPLTYVAGVHAYFTCECSPFSAEASPAPPSQADANNAGGESEVEFDAYGNVEYPNLAPSSARPDRGEANTGPFAQRPRGYRDTPAPPKASEGSEGSEEAAGVSEPFADRMKREKLESAIAWFSGEEKPNGRRVSRGDLHAMLVELQSLRSYSAPTSTRVVSGERLQELIHDCRVRQRKQLVSATWYRDVADCLELLRASPAPSVGQGLTEEERAACERILALHDVAIDDRVACGVMSQDARQSAYRDAAILLNLAARGRDGK